MQGSDFMLQLLKNPKKIAEIKKKEELKKEKEQLKKEEFEFRAKFRRIMYEYGLYNEFNETYKLRIHEKTSYGFVGRLFLNPGLTFSGLQEKVGKLQESLSCIWIQKTKPFQEHADITIVLKPLDESTPFENPGIKPYELYMGLNFALNPIINNNHKHCMFMLSGATGAGKTRLLYCMLLCWIMSCYVNEVEIYLSDIAKNEFANFKYVKHVRVYASELKELYQMMLYLEKEFNRRKGIISKLREQGLATNISDYNRISKVKMSCCYVIIDEYSIVTIDKHDRQTDKEMKEHILCILNDLEKTGRTHGIFILTALQKATKQEMGDSIIKNMSSVRISYRANDFVSSEVLMGDGSAVGLMNRYAVYNIDGGEKDYLFTPLLEIEDITRLLKPYIDKSFRKIDLEAETKNYNEPKQGETKQQKQQKQNKKEKTSETQYIKDSLSKINKELIVIKEDGKRDY